MPKNLVEGVLAGAPAAELLRYVTLRDASGCLEPSVAAQVPRSCARP